MLMLILVGILMVSSQRPRIGTLKQNDAHKELEDQAIVVSHTPTTRDFKKMKDRIGVWRGDAKYGQTIGSHGTGLLPPTEQEWTRIKDNIHVVDDIRLDQTTTIPSKVDHSVESWFPPIGDQEGENSCVAWAVGYYTKTFQEAKEHDWDLSDAEWDEEGHPTPEFQDKIFSPDFIYHLINGGVDRGSTFSTAIDLVAFLGSCSWKNMPYNPHNYTSWPSEEAWREATFYRANSSGIEYMELETDDDIVSLKNWIASDHLALISVDGFQFSELTNIDFWTLDNYDNQSTNHANSIVGFDDDIRYFEQGEWCYGAFKIANSWGKGGWENVLDGCYWISYEAMKQRIGYCMFYRDRTEYFPELVSSFQLEHLKSDDCEISIGIGNYTNPLATKSFSHLVETGEHPFCPNKIVFDITELKDSIPTVINQSFFISFYDKGMSTTHSGTSGWRTNGSSYSWFRLGQTFDIPENGATLKFWSYYEIEEDWDYSYVEVHDLDEDEWYTLPGLKTNSTLPEPQDNPNCPSAFEPSAYYDAERWHAFTGFSKAMYQEEMDLSRFANHTIELYFTYWTDPLVLERGWYIDDIEITEIGLFDDVENDQGNWTNNGWYIAVPESPSTGTISSFSIENYHINSSTLIAMSSSPTVPVNTEDQNHVFVELILHASNTYTDINVSEAKQTIETNPNLVILDVRTQEEHNEGHIENAVLIPVSELESRLDELDSEKDTLVYCRSGGRSATASQILVDNGFSSVYNMLGGITAWRNTGYWIEIVHEGDLIIDSYETFVVENCTYIQKGDVIVEDYGELIVKNTELLIMSKYPWHLAYFISIRDHGFIQVENSRITCERELRYWVGLGDDGEVNITNSLIDGEIWASGKSIVGLSNSTIAVLMILDQSTVSVSDSSIDEAGFWFNDPSQVAELSGLKPMLYNYWNLRENQTIFNVRFNLMLEDTEINSWRLDMRHDCNVKVSESTISFVSVRFNNVAAEISNLDSGFHTLLEFESLVLNNVSIVGWDLILHNSNVTATLSSFSLATSGKVSCLFLNSEVCGVRIDECLGNIFLNQSYLDGILIYRSSLTLQGDFIFVHPGSALLVESNITRNYGVMVMNATEDPVSSAKLKLYDGNYTIVWNGTTSSLGKTDFNLTFADSNYTDTLRLEAVKGNYSATMDVGFLSNTPIVLTMTYFADLNADGTINILDISVVAMAFGSTPEDPDWSVIADLNIDRVINILDISTIAMDFGKTV